MTDNPYAHLFNDEPFDVVDPEAAMPNKARGNDPDLPERVRAFVDEVAADAGREAAEYEVWHNEDQALAFIPGEVPNNSRPMSNPIDLGAPWVDGPYTGENQTPAPAWASEAWDNYNNQFGALS